MDNQFEEDEHARSSRRAQKIEEMKREKERQMQQRERIRKYLPRQTAVRQKRAVWNIRMWQKSRHMSLL